MAEFICPHCHAVFRERAATCPDDGSILIEVPVLSDLSGRVLRQKYRLERSLGQGGFGSVYRATHLVLGKTVAVKVLRAEFRSDSNMVARFFHEARVVTRLTNPHTITTFDLDQAEDGFLFMVMDFVEGRTLRKLAQDEGMPPGRLPWQRALRLLIQVCDSLEEAHKAGVIHRDLKPDNIMVSNRGGEADFVTVLDFGIAKVIEGSEQQNLTAAGMLLGSPAYMSPEQVRGGPLDARSDIYSLGAVAYQVLSGSLPINARQTAAILAEKMLNRPDPPSRKVPGLQLPVDLEYLVMRMLEVDENARPAGAAQVKAEMLRFLAAWPEGAGMSEDLTLSAVDTARPDGTRGYSAPFDRQRPEAAPAGAASISGGTSPFPPMKEDPQPDVPESERETGRPGLRETDMRKRMARVAAAVALLLVVTAGVLAGWAWWSGKLPGTGAPDGSGRQNPETVGSPPKATPSGIDLPPVPSGLGGTGAAAGAIATPPPVKPGKEPSGAQGTTGTAAGAIATPLPVKPGKEPSGAPGTTGAAAGAVAKPEPKKTGKDPSSGATGPTGTGKPGDQATPSSTGPEAARPGESPKVVAPSQPGNPPSTGGGELDKEDHETIRELEDDMNKVDPFGGKGMDDGFDDGMDDDFDHGMDDGEF